MLIGCKDYQTVWQRGDIFLVEDRKKCTYTLYRTVETIAKLDFDNELRYKGKPYYYDTETELFYVLVKGQSAPLNENGMDSLLGTIPVL